MGVLLWLALWGCTEQNSDTQESAPEDTEAPDVLSACDETVVRPLAGNDSDDAVDAHAETYGAEPEPFQVRLSPASADPSTGVGFLWRTDVDTLATVVQYGVDALDQQSEGASFTFGTEDPARIHEVKLCGRLEPGTTYRYRVGGEGGWSEEYQFTTAPEPGTRTFTVAFSGDSRGAPDTWAEVLDGMMSHDPDLLLFPGDMVDLGPEQQEWDDWFEAAGDHLATTLLVPAHGNHEFMSVNYFAQFSLPGAEAYYAFTWGDLTLAVLNDIFAAEDEVYELQPALMDSAFTEASGRWPDGWRMAMHHATTYAICSSHGSNELIRDAWSPTFDAHELQAVLAAHNHVYERSVPIRDGAEVTLGEGTTYLTTGGAGAPLYGLGEEEWFSEVALSTEHYVVAQFGEDGIDFTAYDLTGSVLDAFTIPR